MKEIETTRLVLEPLVVDHAAAMFEVLREPVLYKYLDYPPPASVEHVRDSYARLESRASPDGSQGWLNWVVRPRDEEPIGFVQATIFGDQRTWIAYLLGSKSWGHGYAAEAVRAMLKHVAAEYGSSCFQATVEARNVRSVRLLERVGFRSAPSEESAGHALSPSERLFARRVDAEHHEL
ncbi:MAG: GNAT family N-acetyltransferase [Pseudomonadota bacterium]|nr:GNAT family N-acetyltransferase [Pseudomonadota bacterium]